jgi:hypothetical protein
VYNEVHTTSVVDDQHHPQMILHSSHCPFVNKMLLPQGEKLKGIALRQYQDSYSNTVHIVLLMLTRENPLGLVSPFVIIKQSWAWACYGGTNIRLLQIY